MVDLEAVCRAVGFIEAHLKGALTVSDVAAAVSYSLYHFSREFNQATHYSPYAYLMLRRLTESARALLGSDQRIIDIAYEYQFNNPETFSRGFKRVFGMQPSQLRALAYVDRRLLTPRLRREDIEHVLNGGCAEPALEARGALQLLGLTWRIADDEQAESELWSMWAEELQRQGYQTPVQQRWGLRYYPSDWERRGFLYTVGVETDSSALLLPLSVQHIPAAQYVRFSHSGKMSTVPLSLQYVYHTWVPRSGVALDYRYALELHEADDATNATVQLYFPLQREKAT